MSKRLYTPEHVWIEPLEDGTLLVGITPYAGVSGNLEALKPASTTDVIPPNTPICTLETNKCSYEIQLPFPSNLLNLNPDMLTSSPNMLAMDNWLCKISPAKANWMAELISLDEYMKLVEV